MATNSNRSAGTQVTNRGIVQGNVLVDPKTGLPVDVVLDSHGVRRLCTDAIVEIGAITLGVHLDPVDDQVAIGDPNNGNTIVVESNGSINVNTAISASTDSIAIADATSGNKLKVNADGSINVDTTISNLGTSKSIFSQISSVAINSTSTIQTYIVPVSTTAYIQRIDVSGSNIATYEFYVNSIIQGRKRTYFGGNLDISFEFFGSNSDGYSLNTGDIVTVTVINFRPSIGDFESRIQVIEV